jgi:hypothetical protein
MVLFRNKSTAKDKNDKRSLVLRLLSCSEQNSFFYEGKAIKTKSFWKVCIQDPL